MGWFVAYIVVGFCILAAGVVFMFIFVDDEDPDTFIEGLRIVSLFTAGSWGLAILWPVLLVLLVPALCVYGTWTAFRAVANKGIYY